MLTLELQLELIEQTLGALRALGVLRPLQLLDQQLQVGNGYSSGVGRLYAEDLIVKIEGAAGTMIVSV